MNVVGITFLTGLSLISMTIPVRPQQQSEASIAARCTFKCAAFCKGCGCRGGTGYRKPDGNCAGCEEFPTRCGPAPHSRCKFEGTPIDERCNISQFPPHPGPNLSADKNTQAIQISGKDSNGKRAAFQLVIAKTGYSWIYRQEDQFEDKGAPVSATTLEGLIKDHLLGYERIIAVGLASAEGSAADEEGRAKRRAEQLAEWLLSIAPRIQNIWTLNLGKHAGSCRDCTDADSAAQRPLVLIGLIQYDVEVDVRAALLDALKSDPRLLPIERYTRFDLQRFSFSERNRKRGARIR